MIAICQILWYTWIAVRNGGGAVSKRRRLTPYPNALLVPRNEARLRAGTFESFLPGGFGRKGGCRMTLTETLTFLAVIISLLSLVFTVLFGAFDVAWKIAERQNKNGQKK